MRRARCGSRWAREICRRRPGLRPSREAGGAWDYKVKLPEQAIKARTPGIQQVRRFTKDGEFIGDMIYNEYAPPTGSRTIVDPNNSTRRKAMPADAKTEDLLVPIFRHGVLLYDEPPLADIRAHAQRQLGQLHAGAKRLLNPHEYPVGLEPGLFDLKTRLIFKARPVAA